MIRDVRFWIALGVSLLMTLAAACIFQQLPFRAGDPCQVQRWGPWGKLEPMAADGGLVCVVR